MTDSKTMRTHHPATKTALWKAVMRSLRGSPSYVTKHAQKLIKELYEGGSDCSKGSFIDHFVSKGPLVSTNPYWMLHLYICKKQGWPLLTWEYK